MHVSGNHHVEVLGGPISFFNFIYLDWWARSHLCNACATYVQFSNIFPAQRWNFNWVWNFDDPLTRPGHWVSVLWIERLFWQCATSECFLPKVSVLCSTDHKNFQHNCKFIQYWKVKTRNLAIADTRCCSEDLPDDVHFRSFMWTQLF